MQMAPMLRLCRKANSSLPTNQSTTLFTAASLSSMQEKAVKQAAWWVFLFLCFNPGPAGLLSRELLHPGRPGQACVFLPTAW